MLAMFGVQGALDRKRVQHAVVLAASPERIMIVDGIRAVQSIDRLKKELEKKYPGARFAS